MTPQHSLLTMWHVDLQRDEELIEWDLLLLPLLFGPVSILDNMVLDNPGLIRSIRKPWFRELLKKYSRLGLVTLFHRDDEILGRHVNSMQDLMMIWLGRTSIEESKTIGMASLSDARNKELRELVRGFTGVRESERAAEYIQFVESGPDGIRDFNEGVQILGEILFDESASRSSFRKLPSKTLQVRMLEAAGVHDATSRIATSVTEKASILKRMQTSGFGESQAIASKLIDWNEYLVQAQSDPNSQELFHLMSSDSDAPVQTLAHAAKRISIMDGVPGGLLERLIHAAYFCGIPESNDQDVLWPGTSERTDPGNTTPSLSTAGGSTREREEIGNRIIDALSPDRETLLDRLHRDSSTDKALYQSKQELLNDLHRILFSVDRPDLGASKRTAVGLLGGASSVLLIHQIPGVEQLLDGELLAQWMIQGPIGTGIGLASSQIYSRVYPKFLGRAGMYGRYGGSFYRHGIRCIDNIDRLMAGEDTPILAPLLEW